MTMVAVPYLLLVTFYTPRLSDLTAQHLTALRDAPFNGVASAVVTAYNTDPVPDISAFGEALNLCKQARVKVWPWVFMNRMIARHPEGRSHVGTRQAPEYFKRIKAMDLDNAAGARADFLRIWRLALRLARRLDAPGIVADFEAYNNYRAYSPVWVAEQRGETVDKVIQQLRQLGADLADIVAEEYPKAVIWQLFFDPYSTPYTAPDGRKVTRTCNYVNLGILDRAVEKGIPLTLIDGAETAVGYYQPSLERLKGRIDAHQAKARPFLDKYGERLQLAGTIAPYADCRRLDGWIRRAAGDNPPWKTAADFVPLFKELFARYRWMWIYAASAARFNPYDATAAGPIYEALRQAL